MSSRARRQALINALGNDIAIIPTAPDRQRNSDVYHPFRPDSDFHYLTEFPEPEAVAVLAPGNDSGEYLLFCRERDAKAETWDGYRVGVEGATIEFGVDKAFPIGEIDQHMAGLIAGYERIHYPVGRYPEFDRQVIRWLGQVKAKTRFRLSAPHGLGDLQHLLQGMRQRKDASELDTMRRSGEIAAAAHVNAMQACRPGMFEYEIQAEFEYSIGAAGCPTSYPSIVASGENACVLHYRNNDAEMHDGDLLLVDAGAELECYASDITRTYPINGRFSDAQKEIYEIVLEAQLKSIACARPGNRYSDVHDESVDVISQGLIDLGLLHGSLDEVLETKAYAQFYMHRVGHWIGLDVHDVGAYMADGESIVLEPGFCMTIEPGIYIKPSDGVPERYHGIGIRIEDDIYLTEDGNEVMTSDAPKTIEEIEAVMEG